MLDTERIRNFYRNGFKEAPIHRMWPQLWNKHFRIESRVGYFIKLNKIPERLNFRSIKRLCGRYATPHLYMSVLNWLMPERVGEKSKARYAYPIGGEYVVDVDSDLFWKPHSHWVCREGVCVGCLSQARETTLNLLWKIEENYSDVHVVFSGRRGFHIHVLDFNVRDWTHYNDRNPLKSHEVARFKYTKHLKGSCGGFDRHHFTLSSDVTRIITFPGSLNGETGLICSYLGKREDFEKISISDVLWDSKAVKFLYDLNWIKGSELHSHPEPGPLKPLVYSGAG